MGTEINRKLASIQRIEEVRDIEDADAIQAFRVLGWWVVDKKNAHNVGDLVVYLSIDSWVPHNLAPFLSKGKEPREYNGVKGERLRTVKLRGQISQGLIIKPSSIPIHVFAIENNETGDVYSAADIEWNEGEDVTLDLKIQKWEAPIPAQLQGKAAGNFPTGLIRKTDQERIQNCFGDIQKKAKRFTSQKVWNASTQVLEEHPVEVPADFKEPTYEVTMKLDGSSMTVFRWEGILRVCSRNLELKISDENKDNTFVNMALAIGDKIPDGYAFQGEICGPGIQGNREGFKEHKFFVFDIFDIAKHCYVTPTQRRQECVKLDLNHVPVFGTDWTAPESIEVALDLADGPSINHKIREGLVYKCNEDPDFSFKVISNKFLLKGGD